MTREECIAAVTKAHGNELSPEAIAQIVDEVQARAAKAAPGGKITPAVARQAARELTDSDMLGRKQDLYDVLTSIMAPKPPLAS